MTDQPQPPLGRPLRALVVSYSFPPVGGAGVQRVTKLVKYLPEFGVRPAVLTVANPSVPLRDQTLLDDLPPGLEVLRTPTLEPGYGVKQAAWNASADSKPNLRQRITRELTQVARQVLVPDPQVLWQPGAQRALLSRLWGGGRDDVVLVSAPPFSQFLLAPLARLHPHTAVVLDYRDEWSTYRTTYEMMGSRITAALGDSLEGALLRCAAAVTTATEEFRQNLLGRHSFLRPEQVHAIPNGYDPDDFPDRLPSPPGDRFIVTYAGTLFKMTSPRGLLSAVRRVHQLAPDLGRLLEVRFIGRIVETELDAFAGMDSLGVRRLGYLDHKQVLRELGASHLVLCLLDDVPGAERIYPGKIFELMYLGRPCLVLSPQGALTRLAERHQLGVVLPPRDDSAIAELLLQRLRLFARGLPQPPAAPLDITRYHRRALAGRFAAVMREAVR